mmetsp:Transcript_10521/g.27920  ORF Transcript_10521/g.27920 Transcript_10521/m.27920 type:complete len:124 (-) Transcript_10521:1788-2159(-)
MEATKKDICMLTWEKLMSKVSPLVQNTAVIPVDSSDDPADGDPQRAFMKVFNECKVKRHPVLVTNGRGWLGGYTFRGQTTSEPVELIGVPSHDTIFYISMQGRVATTGTGSAALARQIGSLAI